MANPELSNKMDPSSVQCRQMAQRRIEKKKKGRIKGNYNSTKTGKQLKTAAKITNCAKDGRLVGEGGREGIFL